MTTTTAQAVLIDSRQPAYLHTVDVDAANVIVTELAAGSLLITCADGTMIGVERLPADSLLHAIRRDTLVSRAAALRSLTPWAYVVIVGSLLPLANGNAAVNGSPTGWSWLALQGALATVQETGVTVMQVRSDADLPNLLRALAHRERGPAKLQPVRDAIFASPAEQILAALPGIGETRAEALLRDSGERACLALVSLTDERQNATKGIGPETIKVARQALGLADGEYLVIDSRTS